MAGRRARPSRWAVAVFAGAALAAGCGSTAPSGPPPSSGSAETNPAGTALLNTLASVQGRVRAQLARSGCRPRQIAVSTGEGGAGLGHVGLPLLFRNTGGSACLLSGYPGATLTTADGHRIAARRTPTGYLGGLASAGAPAPVVRVRPGATISAYLEGLDSDPAHGGGACPSYLRLLVSAPGETLTFALASPIARICRPEVHPVVTGTTGRAAG